MGWKASVENDLRTLVPVVVGLFRRDPEMSDQELSDHIVGLVMKVLRPAFSRGTVLRREGIGNGVREVPEAEARGGSGSDGPGGGGSSPGGGAPAGAAAEGE